MYLFTNFYKLLKEPYNLNKCCRLHNLKPTYISPKSPLKSTGSDTEPRIKTLGKIDVRKVVLVILTTPPKPVGISTLSPVPESVNHSSH